MKKLLLCLSACALVAAAPLAASGSATTNDAKVTAVSGLDKQYLRTSMQGDLFEIIGGQLAEHKTRNAAVLRLARTLVRDHSKSLSDATKLAHKLGIAVPNAPTPSEQWELSIVASLRGSAFIRWYSSLEVYDHRQDVHDATDEISDGTNSQVRDDATTELPMLHKHLRLAERALAASH